MVEVLISEQPAERESENRDPLGPVIDEEGVHLPARTARLDRNTIIERYRDGAGFHGEQAREIAERGAVQEKPHERQAAEFQADLHARQAQGSHLVVAALEAGAAIVPVEYPQNPRG